MIRTGQAAHVLHLQLIQRREGGRLGVVVRKRLDERRVNLRVRREAVPREHLHDLAGAVGDAGPSARLDQELVYGRLRRELPSPHERERVEGEVDLRPSDRPGDGDVVVEVRQGLPVHRPGGRAVGPGVERAEADAGGGGAAVLFLDVVEFLPDDARERGEEEHESGDLGGPVPAAQAARVVDDPVLGPEGRAKGRPAVELGGDAARDRAGFAEQRLVEVERPVLVEVRAFPVWKGGQPLGRRLHGLDGLEVAPGAGRVEEGRLLLLQLELASIALGVDALVEELDVRRVDRVVHPPRDEVVELLRLGQLLEERLELRRRGRHELVLPVAEVGHALLAPPGRPRLEGLGREELAVVLEEADVEPEEGLLDGVPAALLGQLAAVEAGVCVLCSSGAKTALDEEGSNR